MYLIWFRIMGEGKGRVRKWFAFSNQIDYKYYSSLQTKKYFLKHQRRGGGIVMRYLCLISLVLCLFLYGPSCKRAQEEPTATTEKKAEEIQAPTAEEAETIETPAVEESKEAVEEE